MTERDPSIDQIHVFVGPKLKAGFIPLSKDAMYLFTTMSYPPHTRIDQSKTHLILKEALKDFTAPIVVEVRERMRSADKVIWRPFENTLVPSPWYRGRVVLIGDAAHTMTPHLTAGGGMAIEDAVILAEALARDGPSPAGSTNSCSGASNGCAPPAISRSRSANSNRRRNRTSAKSTP
jgi:2-polyprenyl-6-methoxyphenol hydroxylase-like FAD-dependent oxidoreductase